LWTLLKYFMDKYNLDIDMKLRTGTTVLQNMVELGVVHRAQTLLWMDADIKSLSDDKFIQRLWTNGHFLAIGLLTGLKDEILATPGLNTLPTAAGPDSSKVSDIASSTGFQLPPPNPSEHIRTDILRLFALEFS